MPSPFEKVMGCSGKLCTSQCFGIIPQLRYDLGATWYHAAEMLPAYGAIIGGWRPRYNVHGVSLIDRVPARELF